MATLRDTVEAEDREELRLAPVMAGGSSLAIWIGGVNREIHRLCTTSAGDPGAYGELLSLTQTVVRADVISGTSAGGLNGAFLALALARGGDLTSLAELWADRGSFSQLLRAPLESDPPSLLRGDAYFLPELRQALQEIWNSGPGGIAPEDAPIHLMITTTAMQGRPRPFVDDYGNVLHESVHRLLFEFARRRGRDDFADPGLVGRLALASRSTASFPVAFEPSYVPVGADHDPLHPDMAGTVGLESSAFVLDGGVLVNRPIAPALRAIFAQPAAAQVRRVLLFIEPDPAEAAQPTPDVYDQPPTLRNVLLETLSTLPRAESVAGALQELAEHNQTVRDRRGVRKGIEQLVRGNDDADLDRMALALFPAYRRQRRDEVVRGLLRATRERRGGPTGADAAQPWWSQAELEAAFRRAPLPLAPDAPGARRRADRAAGDDALTPLDMPLAQWGPPLAERLAYTALDLLRRATWVAPVDAHDLRRRLRERRRAMHRLIADARVLGERECEVWARMAAGIPDPAGQAADRMERLHAALAGLGGDTPVAGLRALEDAVAMTADSLAAAIADAYPLLREIESSWRESAILGIQEKADEFADLLDVVYGTDRAQAVPDPHVLLRRLRHVDVLFVLFAPAVRVEQPVELLQVSGHTPNAFGGPAGIDDKVTGIRTGHFAAFYKRSWRVNDWLWGRLDGAMRLSQALLHPGRLRQLRYTPEEAFAAIRDAALPPSGQASGADYAYLSAQIDLVRDQCLAELSFLADEDLPVPPSVPTCALQVARRLQAEILRQELPRLAEAVDDDHDAGALRNGPGGTFRSRYRTAVERAGAPERIPAETLFALFRDCRIGREDIAGDAGSDLFAQTVSQAALVGVSAAEGKGSGLAVLRGAIKPLRGVLMVLYVLVTGATRAGAFGRSLVSLMLASGGALLAVAAIAEDPPALVASIGAALAAGGVLLAALRSGRSYVLVGLAVVWAGLAGLLLHGIRARPPASGDAELFQTLATVGLLAGATWGLGMVRDPRALPRWFRGPLWTRVLWFAGPVALALAAVALLPDTAACPRWRPLDCEPLRQIVSLELAGTPLRAQRVLDAWSGSRVRAAINGTYADYGFLLVYWIPFTALVAVAAALLRRGAPSRATLAIARRAVLFAWLPIVAAALDAAENVGLLAMLYARADGAGPLPLAVPAATAGLAAGKFALLAASLLFGAFGVAWALASRWRAGGPQPVPTWSSRSRRPPG